MFSCLISLTHLGPGDIYGGNSRQALRKEYESEYPKSADLVFRDM